MQIERTKLLAVLSEALDSVEKEFLGVTDHHAKRVALLCVRMARAAGMTDAELSTLAINALLHDSALNEHRSLYSQAVVPPDALRGHCIAGEENLRLLPGDVSRGFVLYHHENSDGSGPFGKTSEDTPLGAQLIHIADQVDRRFPTGAMTANGLGAIRTFVRESRDTLFSRQACELLLSVMTEETLTELSDEKIADAVMEIPDEVYETDLRALSGLFARIIDYKSPFTRDHSVGLAEKAEAMARYYGWDDELTHQLYCAGALHDIGKLLVDRDVLEKPGKLDQREYQHIQSHAYETFRLLSRLSVLDPVTRWASYHHEKLNGKGYPFGLTEKDLDEQSRLLACLDIYQALTEDRPYKAGMSHGKAISILREMAEKGELDEKITEDIDRVFRTGEESSGEKCTALFQCKVCGHICEDDALPDGYVCPVCGQNATAFLRIS